MGIKEAYKNITDKKTEQKYTLSTEDIDRLVIQDQQGRIVKLSRIVASKDFEISNGYRVSKGDKGGFVESEENISQQGNCWVFGNALVYGEASVKDNAIITNNTIVKDAAKVSGNGIISSSVLARTAKVHNADIENCYVEGWGHIYSKQYQLSEGISFKNMKISNSQFRAGYDIRNDSDFATVNIEGSNFGNSSVYIPEKITNVDTNVYIKNSQLTSGSQITITEDFGIKQNLNVDLSKDEVEQTQEVLYKLSSQFGFENQLQNIGSVSLTNCEVVSSNIQVGEFSLPLIQEGQEFKGVIIKPAKAGENSCECIDFETHNSVQIPLENTTESAMEQ